MGPVEEREPPAACPAVHSLRTRTREQKRMHPPCGTSASCVQVAMAMLRYAGARAHELFQTESVRCSVGGAAGGDL